MTMMVRLLGASERHDKEPRAFTRVGVEEEAAGGEDHQHVSGSQYVVTMQDKMGAQ